MNRVAHVSMGPILADMSMSQLADILNPKSHPEAHEMVKFQCRFCGDDITAKRIVQAIGTCCDSCREGHLLEQKKKECAAVWENLCPEDFRDRDIKDTRFPKPQWEKLRRWYETRNKSIFFYGPSGRGKTWAALEVLKRCLWHGASVGVVWAEQMEAAKFSRDPMHFIREHDQSVLLLDDCFIAAARSESSLDVLRNLIDYRMRNRKVFIITSQVGGDDMSEHIGKYDRGTGIDRAKMEALLRRVRQECEVVSFNAPNEKQTSL